MGADHNRSTSELDAGCPGQAFTSPTPNQMLAAVEALGSVAGVLFIVKNYAGDLMNFQKFKMLWDAPVHTAALRW